MDSSSINENHNEQNFKFQWLKKQSIIEFQGLKFNLKRDRTEPTRNQKIVSLYDSDPCSGLIIKL